MQKGIRPALLVNRAAPGYGKTQFPVKSQGSRILFVDIDKYLPLARTQFFNQCPANALAKIFWPDKKHFDLAAICAHETHWQIAVFANPQIFHGWQIFQWHLPFQFRKIFRQ